MMMAMKWKGQLLATRSLLVCRDTEAQATAAALRKRAAGILKAEDFNPENIDQVNRDKRCTNGGMRLLSPGK